MIQMHDIHKSEWICGVQHVTDIMNGLFVQPSERLHEKDYNTIDNVY